MFNRESFQLRLQNLKSSYLQNPRGLIPSDVESGLIESLINIYLKISETFEGLARDGKEFPGMPELSTLAPEKRAQEALLELLKRMELEFTHKLTEDFMQGAENQVEIGKIKLVCLDGIRRALLQSI